MGQVNPGKRFEAKLFTSLSDAGLFVQRIPDKVYWTGKRLVSEETPADFISCYTQADDGRVRSFLIEAKACSQNRLRFARLEQHQHDALVEFDGMHPDMHGFVAVNFYDPASIRIMDVCFMVPISIWDEYAAGEMKSLSHDDCSGDDRIHLCQKVGTTYDMSRWLGGYNGQGSAER